MLEYLSSRVYRFLRPEPHQQIATSLTQTAVIKDYQVHRVTKGIAVPHPLPHPAIAVVATKYHFVVLLTTGQVHCLGNEKDYQPLSAMTQSGALVNIISAGDDSWALLLESATILIGCPDHYHLLEAPGEESFTSVIAAKETGLATTDTGQLRSFTLNKLFWLNQSRPTNLLSVPKAYGSITKLFPGATELFIQAEKGVTWVGEVDSKESEEVAGLLVCYHRTTKDVVVGRTVLCLHQNGTVLQRQRIHQFPSPATAISARGDRSAVLCLDGSVWEWQAAWVPRRVVF